MIEKIFIYASIFVTFWAIATALLLLVISIEKLLEYLKWKKENR